MTLKELRKRQAEVWARFEKSVGAAAVRALQEFEALRERELRLRQERKPERKAVRR